MLDIIQRVLAEYGLQSCRIDGAVVGKERQRIIDDFNRCSSGSNGDDSDNDEDASGPRICLLTTRACGYGITLTGADRVIVFDPRYTIILTFQFRCELISIVIAGILEKIDKQLIEPIALDRRMT